MGVGRLLFCVHVLSCIHTVNFFAQLFYSSMIYIFPVLIAPKHVKPDQLKKKIIANTGNTDDAFAMQFKSFYCHNAPTDFDRLSWGPRYRFDLCKYDLLNLFLLVCVCIPCTSYLRRNKIMSCLSSVKPLVWTQGTSLWKTVNRILTVDRIHR